MKFKLLLAILFFLLVLFFYLKPGPITGRTSSGISEITTSINAVYNVLNISLMKYELKIPPGNKSEKSMNITAEFPGNTGLNVTLTKSGEIADWISLEINTVNLSMGETQNVKFNVTVPISQALGIYYGWINISSEDGQKKDVNVTVNVTTELSRINVSVNNTIGNPVQYATLFIWNTIPSLVDSGSTDSNGNWISDWLNPGNYTVEVVKNGYATQQQNVTLETGETEQVFITLQPIAAPVLDVSPSSISESALTGATATKVLIIRNIGDLNLVNVTINSTSSYISFSDQLISVIAPGNYTYVNASLGPLYEPGIYLGTIFINSSNDGNYTIPVAFQVSNPIAPSGGGGVPPAIGILKGNISIVQYSERIEVSQGEIKYLQIQIYNIGETILRDTRLEIIGVSSDWYSIEPERIDIQINRSQIFVVKLKIPLNASLGSYPLAFRAISDTLSDTKVALLTIKEVIIEILRIKDIETSKFFVDKRGYINITLINEGARPLNATVSLDFPESFLVFNKDMSKIIASHKEEIFNFITTPKSVGIFTVKMILYYDRKKIEKDIILNVYPIEYISVSFILLFCIIIVFIIFCIIFYYLTKLLNRKHRKGYRRKKLKIK